jgi:hypothetical protein
MFCIYCQHQSPTDHISQLHCIKNFSNLHQTSTLTEHIQYFQQIDIWLETGFKLYASAHLCLQSDSLCGYTLGEITYMWKHQHECLTVPNFVAPQQVVHSLSMPCSSLSHQTKACELLQSVVVRWNFLFSLCCLFHLS